MHPKYPIFIPTKGRFETPYTINAFEKIGVPYTAVIEKQEYESYKKVVKNGDILVVPHQDEGLIATRNWIWDYAQNELKSEYFWTFDDNIHYFLRLHKNRKCKITSGTFLKVIEDFAQRYENLYITGMQYNVFAPMKQKQPPYIPNTRIYSNMFIKTNIPYRNETFYNDDTDLCLRILKDKKCTVLFNAFLIEKNTTLKVKGGMTKYYNNTNKRLEFAQELKKAHPDVVEIVWKFNRWHHKVNYKPFKTNKLIFKKDFIKKSGDNNYGMKIVKVDTLNQKG